MLWLVIFIIIEDGGNPIIVPFVETLLVKVGYIWRLGKLVWFISVGVVVLVKGREVLVLLLDRIWENPLLELVRSGGRVGVVVGRVGNDPFCGLLEFELLVCGGKDGFWLFEG